MSGFVYSQQERCPAVHHSSPGHRGRQASTITWSLLLHWPIQSAPTSEDISICQGIWIPYPLSTIIQIRRPIESPSNLMPENDIEWLLDKLERLLICWVIITEMAFKNRLIYLFKYNNLPIILELVPITHWVQTTNIYHYGYLRSAFRHNLPSLNW